MPTLACLKYREPTNSTVRHRHSRLSLRTNLGTRCKCHRRCPTWEWQTSRWASRSKQTTTQQLTSTMRTSRNLVSKAQSQGKISSRLRKTECRRIGCPIMTLAETSSTTSQWLRTTSMLTIWVKLRRLDWTEQRMVMTLESLTFCLEQTRIPTWKTLDPMPSRILWDLRILL